jgi:hypothetical protein
LRAVRGREGAAKGSKRLKSGRGKKCWNREHHYSWNLMSSPIRKQETAYVYYCFTNFFKYAQ